MSRRQSLGALARASSVTVAAVTSSTALATGEDPVVGLWRRWQDFEDRRIDLRARRDHIYDSSPELKITPSVHYATVYRHECAPGEAPKGQKLYYCNDADIDRAWPPNTTIRQARQGATEIVQAWRADMKRRLVEAREQYQAECQRAA